MHMYYWKFDLFFKYVTPLVLFFSRHFFRFRWKTLLSIRCRISTQTCLTSVRIIVRYRLQFFLSNFMVSQIMLTGGEGQFGQNAQKLQENYKIVVFRSRQRGTCGGLTNFLGSGEDPTQSPSTPLPPSPLPLHTHTRGKPEFTFLFLLGTFHLKYK